MELAAIHLDKSLEIYRILAQRTISSYKYANTLQTGHRRIPIRGWKGNGPAYYHWQQMLPLYDQELVALKERLSKLDQEKTTPQNQRFQTLPK